MTEDLTTVVALYPCRSFRLLTGRETTLSRTLHNFIGICQPTSPPLHYTVGYHSGGFRSLSLEKLLSLYQRQAYFPRGNIGHRSFPPKEFLCLPDLLLSHILYSAIIFPAISKPLNNVTRLIHHFDGHSVCEMLLIHVYFFSFAFLCF